MLLLPGRVPGYSRTDIKLLPFSTSKKRIWLVYQEAAQQDPSVHPVAYTTFCRLWRQLLPSLLLMKPMTDLCWTCQKNSIAILRAANCPDKEKSCVLREAEDHLRVVQCERSHYKTTCDTCKKDIQVGICKLSFLLFFIFIIIFLPHSNTVPIIPNNISYYALIWLFSCDVMVHYDIEYACLVPIVLSALKINLLLS